MQTRDIFCASRSKRTIVLVLLAVLMLANLAIPTAEASIQAGSHYCEGDFISISLPMNDLGPDEYVRLINGATGFHGGLYPGGVNSRPAVHDAAGVALVNEVTPLNSSGLEDPENGRIVMVSVGMSNTSWEFSEFIKLAEEDDEVNPKLAIINGAQNGVASPGWVDPMANAWQVLDQRIQSTGLSPAQVQVAWIKQARPTSSEPGAPYFPRHAEILEEDLEAISKNLLIRFPNIKLVFLSSRTRAYVYWMGLSPEPFAFETGFSVKWLIERQINGDSALNYDPSRGDKVAPYLSWGPYLWADGLIPRSDGFIWTQRDLAGDCVHPSDNGKLKVANQLMAFFKGDTLAAPWFLADYNPQPSPEIQNPLYLPLFLSMVIRVPVHNPE